CNGMEFAILIKLKAAESDVAKAMRLFQDTIEHRLKVAGRGIDNPKNLGGRSLLLQGFARLGDESRVLHRDDRLRREVFQKGDLFLGERPDLPSSGYNLAEK